MQLRKAGVHIYFKNLRPVVTNEWSYTSTLSIRFHDVDRDNFCLLKAQVLQIKVAKKYREIKEKKYAVSLVFRWVLLRKSDSTAHIIRAPVLGNQ
jgi:hypothetical protein